MHRLAQPILRRSSVAFLCLSIALACALARPVFACEKHQEGAPTSSAVQFDPSNLPIEAKGITKHAITLSAQASREVFQDKVQLTLFYEQQADNAAKLTAILKQKTEAALAITKNTSGVSVQTRNFTVYPTTDQKGRISGWQGRTELLLEFTSAEDLAPVGRLAGQLSPIMQISSVRFSLSKQAEQAINAQLANEAIAHFRKEAQQTAKAFGYKHYALADISVHRNNFQIQGSMMKAMATADFSATSTPSTEIPLARGKTTLSVTVAGVVHVLN